MENVYPHACKREEVGKATDGNITTHLLPHLRHNVAGSALLSVEATLCARVLLKCVMSRIAR